MSVNHNMNSNTVFDIINHTCLQFFLFRFSVFLEAPLTNVNLIKSIRIIYLHSTNIYFYFYSYRHCATVYNK